MRQSHSAEASTSKTLEFVKKSLSKLSCIIVDNDKTKDNNYFDNSGPELIRACRLGMANWVTILLDAGVDIEYCDHNTRYPIHFAAEEGHLDVVELLVLRGANIDVKDRWQTSPFMVAINNIHYDISEYLKDKGCDSHKIFTFTS